MLSIPFLRIQAPVTSFLVVTLAVWRVTHLFWGEDGPGKILVRLRRIAGRGFWGQLMDCFYCLSLWVAAPFACVLGHSWIERGVLWLSLSAGAILLERATNRAAKPPPAIWHEKPIPEPPVRESVSQEEPNNVLLR
jgi:hypothetical protein